MQGLYKHNLPRDIKLYLAKPNREIIAPLKFAYQRTITWNEDSPSELFFSLPYEINVNHKREKYAPVAQLKEKFLIKAVTNNYEEWFIITNPTTAEDDTTSLSVNCLSAEQTLAKKKLIEFKRTSYNPLMILNDILPGTGYTVGYINPKLNLKYREFDISSTSKLDFIYTDMTDTYEALVVFDTVDKTVSLYEKNELSDYKGFIVNDRRYLMGIENDIDTTELVTRLHVTGSDGLGIQSVNPTGQRYIDDFSYFLYPFELDKDKNVSKSSFFMEDDLAKALVKYNEYVSGRKDEFKNYLDKKAEEQQELTKLQTDLFDADTELKTVLDSIAWMKEEGLSTTGKQNERKSLNTKIKKLNNDIKSIENSIAQIDEDIKQLGEDLKYDNHLSSTQMEQLNYFIHEEEWSDDNKIDPSDLYESGIEELKERNSPPVNMSVTLANFLKDAKAVNDWKRLNLSDIVRIQKPKLDIDVKVRVSSISINFDEPSIDLELSNYKELNSLENKLKSVFYRVNKVNTDFNKRKIDYDRVANNFNLRNDRIKEIPEEPTVGKNAIKHRKNNDGSVDITVKWTYPDYAKTDKKEHAIDGFMLYFHNDTEDEVYQFTSQMANEQITSVPYPTRTFVYPSVPADLFYTIGVRAYRRVDPDVNRDGILMSPIVRFNDGVGGFDEIESQSDLLVAALASYASPINEENDDEDVSKPYRPEEEINISGRVNGTKQTTGEFPPPNPKVGDIWINTNDGTVNIWNGTSWAGNKLLADLQVEFRDYVNQVAEEDHELKEKLDKAQKDLDEAMERVDSELERIENEVVPEVEQAVKDTFIPRQDYPPDPENLPPSGMWQDITQDPPRMMRWDPELGEWVVLAPNEDEIDEMIDKVVESAKQEYREYTDEEIQKERDRIMKELDEKESVLGDKVSELLDKAEGMYDRVDEINQELIEQQERANQITKDLLNKADVEYVDGELRFKADASVVNSINNTVDDLEATAKNLREELIYYADELEANNGRIVSVETDLDTVEGKLNTTITQLSNFDETISKQQTQIDANAESISFKASQDDLDQATGDISSLNSELSILSNAISLKAEQGIVEDLQSDFDEFQEGTNNRFQSVTKNVSELTVSVEGIVGEVSSINQTVDEHGSTITDISSTVTQHADLIEDRVTKTVYNQDINGIISDLSSFETRIAQTEKDISFKASQDDLDSVANTVKSNSAELSIQAGKIASKVDSVYVEDAIDKIKIGGRNLLTKTNPITNTIGWRDSIPTLTQGFEVPEWNTNDATKVHLTGGDLSTLLKGYLQWRRDDIGLTHAELYTGSIYIKNLREHPIAFGINGLNTQAIELDGYEQKRIVLTGNNIGSLIQFQFRTTSPGHYMEFAIWHPQLEEGTKVTDYQPSYKDIDSSIQSVREYASSIEQTAQRIDTSLSSLQQNHDDLGQKVEKNSTDISIQAGIIEGKLDSITYTRDKEGILESIEQNTLDIKATAKGLEFKADSTVVDNIEETIAGHTTELELLATGLRSKVDEIFVRDAIDGIEIGTKNYARPTRADSHTPYNTPWIYDEKDNSLTSTIVDANRWTFRSIGYAPAVGEKYVISGYMYINGKPLTNADLIASGRLNTYTDMNFSFIDDETGKFIQKYTLSRGTNFLIHAYETFNLPVGTEIKLVDLQFEKGTVASDYQYPIDDILATQEHHNTEISQNSRQIDIQAESITSIEGDIESAESRISVLSGEINQRVKEEVFYKESDYLRSSLAEINVYAQGIEQTVRNIEIGGRNLYAYTSGVSSYSNYNIINSVEERKIVTTLNDKPVSSVNIAIRFNSVSSLLESENNYTFSGYFYKNGEPVNKSFMANFNTNPRMVQDSISIDSNTGYVIVKFHVSGEPYSYLIHTKVDAEIGDKITIEDFSFYKGNHDLGWQPSVEDTDQRMTQAESSITQLSDQISLKVERDGVSSAININPQGVLINANKMDISGVVQFINNSSDSSTVINGGKILTRSITTSQLNVDQIFGNSAVIAKIQSDSVLTANLSATRITTGTLNANNVSVVNLSASSLTSGILDANRVTVRNLTAESIVSQSIEARHIKSLNGLNVNNQFKVDNNGRVSIGNDRITIDYNGISITRPDGVVWMQDGVVRTSYMVGGFDPPFMDKYDTTVGESWPMFTDEGKWYWASADAMVGEGHYIDVRNAGLGYTVGFQRYEFSHDARYLVMGYRSGIDGRNPRHQTRIYDVSDNASITNPDRHPMLHQQWHSRGGSGVVNMTIDLGKPTYQKKAIELRIGINKADRNASTDRLLFRINRTYVTDYPQD